MKFKEIKAKDCSCGCGLPCKLMFSGTRFKGYSKRATECPTSERGRHASAGKGRKGALNVRYKPIGSIRLHKAADGLIYRKIKIADPGVWEYEHRVVMSKLLGRPLKRHELVHHKKDTLSNGETDLIVVNHSEHAKEHAKLIVWAKSGALLCVSCGTNARPHLALDKCSPCYQRKYYWF